jgi:phosphocarrier protein
MTEKVITISNQAGLHARPSSLIVKLTQTFQSTIYFEKDNDQVNAKSIIGLLTLGAAFGTNLKIIADGPDEEIAVERLVKLFESKFEEFEEN